MPAIVAEVNAGRPETWTSLNNITARTLLIGGGPDSDIPQDKLVEIARRVPYCDLITIAAGHHLHTAEPDAFAEAVLSWLKT